MPRLLLVLGCVVIMTSLPVGGTELPPTPDGWCRCTVLGDPMIVFYEFNNTAIILDNNTYYLSISGRLTTKCMFAVLLTTFRPYPDAQLVVPKGFEVLLKTENISSQFFSKYGVWNWLITPNWITDPDNYTDGDSKVTGNLEDGYIMESVDPECKVKFYGKINDSDTVIAIYIDKEFYGTGMIGLCGNCNGVNDEYDRIENGDSLDAPLRIVTSDMIKSNPDFPPYP